MKERHINLKAWEVRAILEGRKTQTRRIVKPYPWFEGHRIRSCCGPTTKSKLSRYEDLISSFDGGIQRRCPYGSPGDRLWVRETWGLMPTQQEWEKWVVYQSDRMAHRAGMADDENVLHRPSDRLDEWTPRIWTGDDPKWKSPCRMPRWASRITLEVIGVGVERLQDISEADAIAEGIQPSELGQIASASLQLIKGEQWPAAVLQYAEQWQSINGPGSWNTNPWVWVVEFQQVKGGEA